MKHAHPGRHDNPPSHSGPYAVAHEHAEPAQCEEMIPDFGLVSRPSPLEVYVESAEHGGPDSGCCAWCDPALRDGPRGSAWRVEDLVRRLREEDDPFARVALYNDPANGSIAERALAAATYGKEEG